MTKYIPSSPSVKQTAFLLLSNLEALYGGAAGGGKSEALLMSALQYVDVPGYAALLLRRTFTDLALPGALMDRARSWLGATDARWEDKNKTWHFPSGATLTFGFLEATGDKFRYQSSEFQFIGFDELTQFPETDYRYLFSRLRKLKGARVPVRMRAGSNPGGRGHGWVKQRFLEEGRKEGRIFVPARMDDNPYLDIDQYRRSLAELDPVTRVQLEMGDWSVRGGTKFRREWFKVVEEAPPGIEWVRIWDQAATEAAPGKDPDYTAGGLIGEYEGELYIGDMRHTRTTPRGVEMLIQQTATLDGAGVNIYIEQEPGSSGVNNIDHYIREVLFGFPVRGHRTTGAKELRINLLSAKSEARKVNLVAGSWIGDFLDEAEGYPSGHDDQLDVAGMGIEILSKNGVGVY
jgi:predicted phage terminase large subunit-like protein